MVTEFNIYLRDRVHECDILIYSLPYRDGLTATNRMVIENCIKSYSLYKIVAQRFDADLSAHIDRMLKTCYEKLNLSAELGTSNIDETNIKEFFAINSPIKLSTYLKNLCYRITSTVNAATEIAAHVIGMEIHFSFGRAHSGISLDAEVQKSHAKKFEVANNIISILSDACGLLYYHISGVSGSAELAAGVESIIKRHRLLSEVDNNTLTLIDNMTIDELDYVILT